MTAHTVGVFKFTASSSPGRSCADDPTGQPAPLASDVDSALSGFRSVDCPLRLRVDDAFACLREDDKDWVGGWRTQFSCPTSRHATLVAHLYADQEPSPEFLQQSPRRSPGPALDSGQRSRRQIDKLQVFSRNPGPASGSDQRALADHLHGTWTHSSVLKEASFVTDRTLTEHINVITQHHCSVLLNKDTFCGTSRARRSRFCARSHVPRGLLRAWW